MAGIIYLRLFCSGGQFGMDLPSTGPTFISSLFPLQALHVFFHAFWIICPHFQVNTGCFWLNLHRSRRSTIGVRDLYRKIRGEIHIQIFGKIPTQLIFNKCVWQSVLSKRSKIQIRNFLVLEFSLKPNMGIDLTRYYCFWREILVRENQLFTGKQAFMVFDVNFSSGKPVFEGENMLLLCFTWIVRQENRFFKGENMLLCFLTWIFRQ